jgi:hypothetical protein
MYDTAVHRGTFDFTFRATGISRKSNKNIMMMVLIRNHVFFHFRNRFKSFDVCMGFCNAARQQFGAASEQLGADYDLDKTSLVAAPPLGPRPDLVSEVDQPQYEEYDEARCEVRGPLIFCDS